MRFGKPARFDQSLVKVCIPLGPGTCYETESVWAKPLDRDLYRILNVPFDAMGLAYEDIVHASERDGTLLLESVERRSGHSTYRFVRLDGIREEQWTPYWQPLQELGCSYANGSRLFAVDVPPDADIHQVYAFLAGLRLPRSWGAGQGVDF